MWGIFEFGSYWKTSTFFIMLAIGITVVLFARAGARYNYKKKNINGTNDNPINIYYILAFVILWFFYTFKDVTVGADTNIYLQDFFNAEYLTIDYYRMLTFHQIEPLYVLLIKFIKLFTNSTVIYFGVIGGIIAYGYMQFIRNFWTAKSNFIFLIPFIVSYQNSMSGVRNALGITFILLSICALKKNMYFKATLLTIIGSLFHYTIIVNLFVIIYYLIFENRKKISKSKIIISTTFITIFCMFFISYLNNYLSGTKYVYYSDSGGTLVGNWYVILGILLAIYSVFKLKIKDKNEQINILIALSNSIILVVVLGTGAYRLTYYYAFSRMYVWSYISREIYYGQHISIRFVIKIICFAFILFYLLFRMSRNSGNPGFEYNLIF